MFVNQRILHQSLMVVLSSIDAANLQSGWFSLQQTTYDTSCKLLNKTKCSII